MATKIVPKQEENTSEADVSDFLEKITPFIETISPIIIEYQKSQAPLVKRNQIINFIIMMTILLSVSILGYHEIIDGSAVTGLIGAVIGYVFGGLYNARKK